MTIEAQFSEIAGEIAFEMGQRQSELQKELADINTKKALKEAELESAKLSVKRVFDFKPVIDGQYQCPRCFIRSGRNAIVHPIDSDIDVLDAWRCSFCGLEFTTRE